MSNTPNPEVADVFKRVNELLRSGSFSAHDIDFIERFLEAALESTGKVKARIAKATRTPDQNKAHELLSDGICAETFVNVATALADERAAVWREVLAIAERERIAFRDGLELHVCAVERGYESAVDNKQTYAFTRDVMAAATKATTP